jgi:hypothetical protein
MTRHIPDGGLRPCEVFTKRRINRFNWQASKQQRVANAGKQAETEISARALDGCILQRPATNQSRDAMDFFVDRCLQPDMRPEMYPQVSYLKVTTYGEVVSTKASTASHMHCTCGGTPAATSGK